MTNSYGMVNQPQQNYVNYPMMHQSNQGANAAAGVFGAATLGFLGGGTYGYLKNRRPVKHGEVTDFFAKKAFDRYIDKGLDSSKKKFYTQAKDILKKLESVSTPEKLKSLLNKNKAVNTYAFPGFTVNEMCNALTSANLDVNKDNLQKALDAVYNKDIETMRGHVKLCWDSQKKKFVKPSFVSEKIFDSIKSTASKLKWNEALRMGGIGAAILGGATLLYKAGTSYMAKLAQKRQIEAFQNAMMEQQQNVQMENAQQQNPQMQNQQITMQQ